MDMKYFDKVLRVDKESLIARVQAGISGPDLIEKLKSFSFSFFSLFYIHFKCVDKRKGFARVCRAYGVTLRHFPQSFEFSTVGGWVATRAGGHYATLKTHIDDVLFISIFIFLFFVTSLCISTSSSYFCNVCVCGSEVCGVFASRYTARNH